MVHGGFSRIGRSAGSDIPPSRPPPSRLSGRWRRDLPQLACDAYDLYVRRIAIAIAVLSDLTAIITIASWAPEKNALLSGLFLGVGILAVIALALTTAVASFFAWRAQRLHLAGVAFVSMACLVALASLALTLLAHQSRLKEDPFTPSRSASASLRSGEQRLNATRGSLKIPTAKN